MLENVFSETLDNRGHVFTKVLLPELVAKSADPTEFSFHSLGLFNQHFSSGNCYTVVGTQHVVNSDFVQPPDNNVSPTNDFGDKWTFEEIPVGSEVIFSKDMNFSNGDLDLSDNDVVFDAYYMGASMSCSLESDSPIILKAGNRLQVNNTCEKSGINTISFNEVIPNVKIWAKCIRYVEIGAIHADKVFSKIQIVVPANSKPGIATGCPQI